MLTRRHFLAGAAGLTGAAALGVAPTAALAPAGAVPESLPDPAASGIEHVVVVMMENRSYDHFFGWWGHGNGIQAGLSFPDHDGNLQPTHRLRDFQGCSHPDPDHSFDGGRTQLDGGKCDGWLLSGDSDAFSIGYYTQNQLPFYGNAVPNWTVCDSYFAAIMAPTYPNRLYQHSAQTDRITNTTTVSTLPTIWDRLRDAAVTGTYYYNDVPFLALWGTTYLDIAHPYRDFLTDCAAGTLPAVSYIDPRFLDEGSGTAGDDHPHADIRVGQHFLNQIYHAVTSGPGWAKTLLVVNYDEWGGFFDHVAPTVAPDAHPEWGLRGFRVPCLIVSPRARRGHVDRHLYDHTSILRLIEWRWHLPPLSPRDAAAVNLAHSLSFSHPLDLSAPRWHVPPVVGQPCGTRALDSLADWLALRDLARDHGWRV